MTLPSNSLSLRVTGEAGEGVSKCGELLADLLARAGHHVLFHRGAMRTVGAPASVELRVADSPMRALTGNLDVLFAWSQDGYDRHRESLWPEGVLLYDPERVRPRESDAPIRHALPLSKLAGAPSLQSLDRAKAFLAAGALARLLGVDAGAAGSVSEANGAVAGEALEEGYGYAGRGALGVMRFEVARSAVWPGALVTGARLTAEAIAHEGVRFAAATGGASELPLGLALEEAGIQVREQEDAERAIIAAKEMSAGGVRAMVLTAEGLHGLPPLWAHMEGARLLLVCAPREESASDPSDLCALCDDHDRGVLAPGMIEECGPAARIASRATFDGRSTTLYIDPLLEDCAETLSTETRDEAGEDARFSAALTLRAEAGGKADATVGIISWGAMEGPVQEAVAECRERGVNVAHAHVRRLLPLDEQAWIAFLAPLTRVVVAEPEPSDPVATLLQERFGVTPERIWWPAAVPLSPSAVVDALLAGA